MSEPKTRKELESTSWFRRGVETAKQRKSLKKAVACLRFGCWQYDAFVAGYDSVSRA